MTVLLIYSHMGGEKGIQSPLHILDRVQRPDVCNLTIITLRNLERILVLEVFLEVFLRVRSILIEEASKKKLLVILGLNLTIMQTTTVKRSKLTNDTLAARANQLLLLLLLFFLIFFFFR